MEEIFTYDGFIFELEEIFRGNTQSSTKRNIFQIIKNEREKDAKFIHPTSHKYLIFCICIAIDIKSNLASIKDYDEKIFDRINDEDSGIILKKFINEIEQEKIFTEVTCSECYPQYVRVLTKTTFTKRYCQKDDEDEFITNSDGKYIIDEEIISYGGWRSSGDDVVWVFPIEDYNKINAFAETEMLDKTKAVVFFDYLGLGLGMRPNEYFKYGPEELIALIYCSKFHINTKLYQPNTTHANWKNERGLFLSYKKSDSHGRTYSETPISKKIKNKFGLLAREKIHTISKYYSDEFTYLDLGKTIDVDYRNTEYERRENIPEIIIEAFNRLVSI